MYDTAVSFAGLSPVESMRAREVGGGWMCAVRAYHLLIPVEFRSRTRWECAAAADPNAMLTRTAKGGQRAVAARKEHTLVFFRVGAMVL